MIDYEHWLDRINNALEIQKQLSLEHINLTLTRREAIELRQMVDTLREFHNIELCADLKPGETIKCGDAKECTA